jgi:hypothetical protein
MAADAQAEQKLAASKEQLKSFGRDPAKFGIEGWLACIVRPPKIGRLRRTVGVDSVLTW